MEVKEAGEMETSWYDTFAFTVCVDCCFNEAQINTSHSFVLDVEVIRWCTSGTGTERT